MKQEREVSERVKEVKHRVLREAVFSLRYVLLLFLLLPPALVGNLVPTEYLGAARIPIIIILFMPSVGLGILGLRHQKRRLKELFKELKICHKCQYDLTGNESGTCPECGTEIKA